MKNVVVLLFLFLSPLTVFCNGRDLRLLDSYYISHKELRKSIYTNVIPFLVEDNKPSSRYYLNVSFDGSGRYIYISVPEKGEYIWDDYIIGYTTIAGYTCILSGDNSNRFINKSLWNIPKAIVFSSDILPCRDGTIEWVFRLDGERVKLLRFNSEW